MSCILNSLKYKCTCIFTTSFTTQCTQSAGYKILNTMLSSVIIWSQAACLCCASLNRSKSQEFMCKWASGKIGYKRGGVGEELFYFHVERLSVFAASPASNASLKNTFDKNAALIKDSQELLPTTQSSLLCNSTEAFSSTNG